ncbi:MAG: ankyrin repeat domain-containing protein [Chromatiales bacterium]|nr:ankyrin repeat domain-containing protein [Chromatiales bacterium]
MASSVAACGRPAEPTMSLYRAVEMGNLDQVLRHVAWGSDFNERDVRGQTVLHRAAAAGRSTIVEKLLAGGADPNLGDSLGDTPLVLAARAGHLAAARALFDGGAKDDPTALLFVVAAQGLPDRRLLDLVLQRGAKINAKNDRGETPLHVAVVNGDRLVVRALVAERADLNATDADGRRPADIALQNGDNYLYSLLQRQGGS